ncbi:hypothetical protein HGRIS_014488 [Hohenbuehelia grisea]
MNAFMIFARRRRPQVSAENQSMRTGDISKILSREWNSMGAAEKQFYLDQAKLLKDNFNSKYPDYVYRRRPNNSRRRRKQDQTAPNSDNPLPSAELNHRDHFDLTDDSSPSDLLRAHAGAHDGSPIDDDALISFMDAPPPSTYEQHNPAYSSTYASYSQPTGPSNSYHSSHPGVGASAATAASYRASQEMASRAHAQGQGHALHPYAYMPPPTGSSSSSSASSSLGPSTSSSLSGSSDLWSPTLSPAPRSQSHAHTTGHASQASGPAPGHGHGHAQNQAQQLFPTLSAPFYPSSLSPVSPTSPSPALGASPGPGVSGIGGGMSAAGSSTGTATATPSLYAINTSAPPARPSSTAGYAHTHSARAYTPASGYDSPMYAHPQQQRASPVYSTHQRESSAPSHNSYSATRDSYGQRDPYYHAQRDMYATQRESGVYGGRDSVLAQRESAAYTGRDQVLPQRESGQYSGRESVLTQREPGVYGGRDSTYAAARGDSTYLQQRDSYAQQPHQHGHGRSASSGGLGSASAFRDGLGLPSLAHFAMPGAGDGAMGMGGAVQTQRPGLGPSQHSPTAESSRRF